MEALSSNCRTADRFDIPTSAVRSGHLYFCKKEEAKNCLLMD